MNETLNTTQELPVVESEAAFTTNAEKQLDKAQALIDKMLHALGGAKMYRNYYTAPFNSKQANDWYFLVGLGLAKLYRKDPDNLGFEVTCQGIAYLKSIGVFNVKPDLSK